KLNGANVTIAGDGQVILNIAGTDTDNPVQLSGQNRINSSGSAANFLLRYAGRSQIDLGGQTDSYGVIYAPNAAVRLSGNSDWYGALVVKSLDNSGSGALHYDRNLSINGFRPSQNVR